MMRHSSLRPTALLLLLFGFWSATLAHAQCTTAVLYTDLKAGFVVNGDPSAFDIISPLTPSSKDSCKGWHEMVVRIDLPRGCTSAIIDTDYEGTPVEWTLNIGDSPTNDGFSGDTGTTAHNAELWILGETLSLANAGNSPSVIDSPLVHEHVSLHDSALKFLVRDQFVSWGQPYQFAQSPNNKLLYALPDPTMAAESHSIYVGMNRVVYGAQWNGRTGCGLRWVVLRFQ